VLTLVRNVIRDFSLKNQRVKTERCVAAGFKIGDAVSAIRVGVERKDNKYQRRRSGRLTTYPIETKMAPIQADETDSGTTTSLMS
jgi:hypothetical protein